MTIRHQIIFSSTFVAILAAFAAYMSWKSTQPIQQELVHNLTHHAEEIQFLDDLKVNLTDIETDILDVLRLLSISEMEEVIAFSEKGKLLDFRIKTLQVQIKSYQEFTQDSANLALTKNVLSLSESLRKPIQQLLSEDHLIPKQRLATRTEIQLRKTTAEFKGILNQATQSCFNKIKQAGEKAKVQTSQLTFWIILTGSLIFFMAIIFGQVIAYYLSKSLEQLRSASRDLKAGNYATRVGLSVHNEFGKIGETFDTMAANLEQSIIIEAQKKELEHLNEQLKTKNDSLDRFVYRVSHDLKAPVVNITSLLKFVQTKIGIQANPQIAQSFVFLEQSAQKLQQTILDLLDVSRIERSLKTTKEWVDIQTILDKVQLEQMSFLEQNKASIHTDFQVAAIYFSAPNFQNILSNMITNSVKYQAPDRNPEIHLSTIQTEDTVCLIIKDNGIGINLDKYGGKLFKMFNRFHDHVEGSGVGLYIVKKILDDNGGKITVKSTEGKGTTFSLFINQDKVPVKDQLAIESIDH